MSLLNILLPAYKSYTRNRVADKNRGRVSKERCFSSIPKENSFQQDTERKESAGYRKKLEYQQGADNKES